MQGYRQSSQVWNASRFVLMNAGELPSRPRSRPAAGWRWCNRWISSG